MTRCYFLLTQDNGKINIDLYILMNICKSDDTFNNVYTNYFRSFDNNIFHYFL